MGTVVYRYGLRGHAALPEVLWWQVRAAHRFRNALVALEHGLEQAKREVWATDPAWADADRQMSVAEQQIEQLTGRAKREHVQDRDTATRPQTAKALREARAMLTAARRARKHAATLAYPLLKPRFEQVKADHYALVKACRQSFSAEGLYWATYNVIEKRHRVSVRLVEQRRKNGQPGQARFHRFDGSGLIAVQLHRSAVRADPPRTPALLASGTGKWRNVLSLTPWQDPATFDALPRHERRRVGRTGQVSLSVGGGRTVTLPVVVHRMLPADADVCAAELVVSHLAGKIQAALCVMVKVPDPEPVQGRPPVAVHTGWRTRPDGSLRVAVWASPAPLPPPRGRLADAVVAYDGGRWGELVLPARMVDVAGRAAALRSRRDLAFDPVRDKLAAWLDEHPQPDPTTTNNGDDGEILLTGGRVRKWRSPARLAALTIRWRTTPPDGAAEVVALLEAWRVQDKHLWSWEANERDQSTARRDDLWRQAAAWLNTHTGLLVIDDTDLTAVRRRPDAAEDDPLMPGVAAAKARARAMLAAPGRLRQRLTATAERVGVAVHTVTAAGLTRTHRACGHTAAPDPQYAVSTVVTCPHCRLGYDQDHNAALIMLDRATGGGHAPP